jgi:hypothetical protein
LERTAALSLTTSEVEKRLTECLARHPLLSEADLASVLHLDRRLVRSAVERATARGLIAHFERSGDRCLRYCLAPAGLRVLALRDGVPVRRYARHAPVTVLATGEGERAPTLLQQYEHTIGANGFFIAWLDRPKGGPRLLSWPRHRRSTRSSRVLRRRCSDGPICKSICNCEGPSTIEGPSLGFPDSIFW